MTIALRLTKGIQIERQKATEKANERGVFEHFNVKRKVEVTVCGHCDVASSV